MLRSIRRVQSMAIKPTVAIFIFILFCFPAFAMKKDNLVLCSPMQGQILNNGQPVAGLRVEQRLLWNMEKEPRIAHATTDEQGYFTFPKVVASANFSWLAQLLHVPAISRTIYLLQDDQRILAYSGGRNSYREDGDFKTKPENFKCDLNTLRTINSLLQQVDCEILNTQKEQYK